MLALRSPGRGDAAEACAVVVPKASSTPASPAIAAAFRILIGFLPSFLFTGNPKVEVRAGSAQDTIV
ncbi:hypothetical protein GCM10027187_51850 [Streptosporangium sandarakinum]